MARICDICGEKLGWKAFHCQDGVICKKCYQIVSNNFTTTITKNTLSELKQSYQKNASPVDLGEDGFFVTKKIGSCLLLDERNEKFCIPSNRKITGEYARPEIFRYAELDSFKLFSQPELPPERLAELVEDRKNSIVIKNLSIRLRLVGGKTCDIVLIPSPVRSASYAFRKSYQLASKIILELDYLYSVSTQEEKKLC